MNITTDITLTPKELAETFWNMDGIQQAQFFEELHNLVDGLPYPAHSLGELQWFAMSDEIEKRPKAKQMACALASHIFVRATNYLEHAIPYLP